MLKDYYTKYHYDKEESLRIYLEKLYNVTLKRNKTLYKYDISVIKDGLITGLLELKDRSHYFGYYKTYTVSLDKIREGIQYETFTGLPCTLVVRFSCGTIASYRIQAEEVKTFNITHGGRTDRNDPNDLEPLVNIPLNYFKILVPTKAEKETS
jgi:hypothetical protein